MKIDAVILFLLFTTVGNTLFAQQVNDSVFENTAFRSFKLLDAGNNQSTAIQNMDERQLLLFVFLSPECPLCKNYSPVLNDLQKQFGNQVAFAGIIPGRTYSAATVKAFAKKYNISFPLFIDPVKKLTNYLHAAITPEIIVLNNRYELVYKGAIDNRMKQLGVKRWQATENYLADAVSQYLQHTAVAVKRVKATGCLINDF